MKKAFIAALCLIVVFSFSDCGGILLAGMAILDDDRTSKNDIFSYVIENENLLSDCIESGDYNTLNNSIIKDINPTPEKDFVEFSCGGSGFGSATQYCGFYYSADDDITEIWCGPTDDAPLSKSGDGHLWKQKDGDNSYYTENICGHFYYYEASY